MADVVIDAQASGGLANAINSKFGIFYRDTLIGYQIYFDSSANLVYKKTPDGGATWGSKVNILTNSVYQVDCLCDWEIPGDAGDTIHFAYVDFSVNEVRYISFDVLTETIGTPVTIQACAGTGVFYNSTLRTHHHVVITKSEDGNLAVACRYVDSGFARRNLFYTSEDGVTWNIKLAVTESVDHDLMLMFPGNETDDRDLWCVYYDSTATELSLKTYDDSDDSWSEQVINADINFGGVGGESGYILMAGRINPDDKHLILTVWNKWNDAAASFLCYDINGASSIVQKTNILTNTDDASWAGLVIDPSTYDYYVYYQRGTIFDDTPPYYKKSPDGGVTWGDETSAGEDVAARDYRWMGVAPVKASWGGRVQASWFDHDQDDLYTNVNTSIIIQPSKFPSWDLSRVTAIRHVYRPGSYRMEVSLGDVSTSIQLAQQFPTAITNLPPPTEQGAKPSPPPTSIPPTSPESPAPPEPLVLVPTTPGIWLPKSTADELFEALGVSEQPTQESRGTWYLLGQNILATSGLALVGRGVQSAWEGLTPWKEEEGETLGGEIMKMAKRLDAVTALFRRWLK